MKLYKQGELGRSIMDVLREAGKPMGVHAVVSAMLLKGGYAEEARPALTPRVRGNLAYLHNAGKVAKNGRGMSVKWFLADGK